MSRNNGKKVKKGGKKSSPKRNKIRYNPIHSQLPQIRPMYRMIDSKDSQSEVVTTLSPSIIRFSPKEEQNKNNRHILKSKKEPNINNCLQFPKDDFDFFDVDDFNIDLQTPPELKNTEQPLPPPPPPPEPVGFCIFTIFIRPMRSKENISFVEPFPDFLSAAPYKYKVKIRCNRRNFPKLNFKMLSSQRIELFGSKLESTLHNNKHLRLKYGSSDNSFGVSWKHSKVESFGSSQFYHFFEVQFIGSSSKRAKYVKLVVEDKNGVKYSTRPFILCARRNDKEKQFWIENSVEIGINNAYHEEDDDDNDDEGEEEEEEEEVLEELIGYEGIFFSNGKIIGQKRKRGDGGNGGRGGGGDDDDDEDHMGIGENVGFRRVKQRRKNE